MRARQQATTGPSESNAMLRWYYRQDGKQFGPVGSRELKLLAASGELRPTDWVRREDSTSWVEASRGKGLIFATNSADIAAKPTPPPEIPSPLPIPETAPPSKLGALLQWCGEVAIGLALIYAAGYALGAIWGAVYTGVAGLWAGQVVSPAANKTAAEIATNIFAFYPLTDARYTLSVARPGEPPKQVATFNWHAERYPAEGPDAFRVTLSKEDGTVVNTETQTVTATGVYRVARDEFRFNPPTCLLHFPPSRDKEETSTTVHQINVHGQSVTARVAQMSKFASIVWDNKQEQVLQVVSDTGAGTGADEISSYATAYYLPGVGLVRAMNRDGNAIEAAITTLERLPD